MNMPRNNSMKLQPLRIQGRRLILHQALAPYESCQSPAWHSAPSVRQPTGREKALSNVAMDINDGAIGGGYF